MGLKAKILEKCDKKIEIMEKAECPQWVKEKVISEGRVSKEILEIVCGIQGITIDTAIQILNNTKEIIREVAMTQEI
ncbi:MAG: hypothetical protein HFI70_08215 [Lachnospiraceae bacterium]|nr:hypothetical protein [Lachnospiraceae bacterium]